MRRAVLISNPVASGVTPAVEAAVLHAVRGHAEVELVRTERPLHARDLARAAADDGCDAVLVLAGDGTANEVLNGVGVRVAIGLLPAGGTSVLPRSLGLPRDVRTAAGQVADALAAGRERRIAVGTLDGRRFGFAAGVGLDAEAVRRVDGRGRARGRRPGDLVFGAEVARLAARGRYARPLATLAVGGMVARVSSVLVANVHPWTYVGPRALKLAPHARAEGGLDVVAPRRLLRRDVPALARYLLVTGGHVAGRDARIVYCHDVEEAVVTCDEPLPAQVDGDDVGDVRVARIGLERDGARLLI